MNIYFLFIIILMLIGIKIFIKDFNKDYLSQENTACVKGIFILIVFYSHIVTYIKTQKKKDFLMLGVRNWLGQLMVTLFLFYSGYGVYESIKKKKENYINAIPKNRILKTFFHFAIAVTSFFTLNLVIHNYFPVARVLLSYIGWYSIGNSNWYIFDIVILYFITYLSFKIFDKNDKHAIIFTYILTFIFIFFMKMYRPAYCYNTVLCYNFGLTYSYCKKTIEKMIVGNNKKYFMAIFISFIGLLIMKKYSVTGYMYYELLSIIFVIFIVGLTMKINLNSKILKWFGDNLFWMYILQRLPMMLFQYLKLNKYAYKYTFICFIMTLLLSFIYSKICEKLDKKIFVRGNGTNL